MEIGIGRDSEFLYLVFELISVRWNVYEGMVHLCVMVPYKQPKKGFRHIFNGDGAHVVILVCSIGEDSDEIFFTERDKLLIGEFPHDALLGQISNELFHEALFLLFLPQFLLLLLEQFFIFLMLLFLALPP